MADENDQKKADKSAAANQKSRDAAVKADEKAHNDGAIEGAKSVAEAIQRVADAAIADIQGKNIGKLPEVIVEGGLKSGNSFVLRGDGFSSSGTVTVNGAQARTTEWGPQRIVGELPADVKDGDEVTIHIDSETRKVGHFGPQRRSVDQAPATR